MKPCGVFFEQLNIFGTSRVHMWNLLSCGLRLMGLGLLCVWIVSCAVAWLDAGLLIGFFSWGVLCGSGVLLLAVPPVCGGRRLSWTFPMSLQRMFPLLGWMSVLVMLLYDLPVGKGSDGEILAVGGILWFGVMVVGAMLLAWLGKGFSLLMCRFASVKKISRRHIDSGL